MLDVTSASPSSYGALTIFPLVAPTTPALPYLLLTDALHSGDVVIGEVGEGTVPQLLAVNKSDKAVLILDGEQLIGARQNRTTNRSLILGAGSETLIPVSCMEHGRWRWTDDHFRPTAQSSPTTVRRKVKEVEAARARRGEDTPIGALAEAQGAVWHSIAEYSANLDVRSPTGALDAIHTTRGGDIEEWVPHFRSVPDQIGLLAFVGSQPLGLDIVGSAALYGKVHERLLRGYITDAMALAARLVTRPGGPDPEPFLGAVRGARRVELPTVGIGKYQTLTGEVIGGELSDEHGLVHLSAFPPAPMDGDGRNGSPIAPPSLRRRR